MWVPWPCRLLSWLQTACSMPLGLISPHLTCVQLHSKRQLIPKPKDPIHHGSPSSLQFSLALKNQKVLHSFLIWGTLGSTPTVLEASSKYCYNHLVILNSTEETHSVSI